MTVRINGEVIEASVFLWDECHKFYLVTSSEGRRQLKERSGWDDDDFLPVEQLPDLWAQSCPLRFIISDAVLTRVYVPQCAEEPTITVE